VVYVLFNGCVVYCSCASKERRCEYIGSFVDMEGSFVVVYWLFCCGVQALLLWYIGSLMDV